MSRPIVVVGAGGFGRETLDVIEAVNAAAPEPPWAVLGVLDDDPAPRHLDRLTARGVDHLGSVRAWLDGGHRADYVVAVGDPAARARIAARLAAAGLAAATLVHPQAGVGSGVVLGPGTVVCAGAQISTNVRLGAHVHLNPNVTVGHDTVCADHVSVNPAATLSGECGLEAGVLIGAAAVVLQGLVVGAGAVVGAAACVTRDVAPGAVVKGVPAR